MKIFFENDRFIIPFHMICLVLRSDTNVQLCLKNGGKFTFTKKPEMKKLNAQLEEYFGDEAHYKTSSLIIPFKDIVVMDFVENGHKDHLYVRVLGYEQALWFDRGPTVFKLMDDYRSWLESIEKMED